MIRQHLVQVVIGGRLNAAGLASAIMLGAGIAGPGSAPDEVAHVFQTATVIRIEGAAIGRCPAGRNAFCVVDGDTVRYRGERIRLSDINTPEIGRPGCAAERQLGERATLRLIAILNGGPFELVDAGLGRDRYGRLLRELRRGDQSIGAMLVAEGLAHRWQGRKENWCA